MATITEDYVSFETAKLLKEKGFQQLQNDCGYFTTEMVYSINADKNGEHHFAHQYPVGVYNRDEYIAAPTLQMTMKWLREVHNLQIQIAPITLKHKDWTFGIYKEFSPLTIDLLCFLTYEQSCEAAIKYCLEHLI